MKPPVATSSARPEPPLRLGRMQLTLRLAAGQAVEHVAAVFRRSVAEIQRRAHALPVRRLVAGLTALATLPAPARLARLAARALRYLHHAIETGAPGAARFVELSHARGQDPALALAELAERQLARVAQTPEGPGRRRQPRPHQPKPLVTLRDGDAPARRDWQALRFAYAMRDQLIVADGRILQAQRHELESAPPQQRQALLDAMLRAGRPYAPEPPPPRSPPKAPPQHPPPQPAPGLGGRRAGALWGADRRPRVPGRDRLRPARPRAPPRPQARGDRLRPVRPAARRPRRARPERFRPDPPRAQPRPVAGR